MPVRGGEKRRERWRWIRSASLLWNQLFHSLSSQYPGPSPLVRPPSSRDASGHLNNEGIKIHRSTNYRDSAAISPPSKTVNVAEDQTSVVMRLEAFLGSVVPIDRILPTHQEKKKKVCLPGRHICDFHSLPSGFRCQPPRDAFTIYVNHWQKQLASLHVRWERTINFDTLLDKWAILDVGKLRSDGHFFTFINHFNTKKKYADSHSIYVFHFVCF